MAAADYQPLLNALRERLAARVQWLREQWAHLAPSVQLDAVTDAEADWLLRGATYHVAPGPAALLPGEPERLRLLGRHFGLTPLERWAVFLCLAPSLEPGLERLYAYAQDHPTLTAPTPALVLSLSDAQSDELKRFLPTAPLRRFRLLQADAAQAAQPLSQRSLALDDRLAGYLLGDDAPDHRIGHLLTAISGSRMSPSHADLVPRLVQHLKSGPVNLIGPAAAGVQGLAEAACRKLRLRLFALNFERLTVSPQPDELLQLAAREARLQHAALLVEAHKDAPADHLHELAAAAPHLLLASREKLIGSPLFLPPIPKAEQLELWQSHLPEAPADLVESLVEQFDMTPDAIADVASAGDAETLWELCRERGRKALDGMAQRLETHTGWGDLILPPDTERHLREIADQCRHRFTVYERWGFGHRLTRGRGVTALFAGPSGCGKTTAAEVLATELGMDLYRIDLAGMVSKYIGETEKNLRRVFDAAEQAGAILLFDEADALFGKRSEVKDAHDRYANIEIDYLLQRMEQYRGVAILATNMRDALDQAFMRRLRFVVDFPFPEGEERMRLWQHAFPAGVRTENLDCRWLARLELAGGNITTIAVNAAFMAAAEGQPVSMVHVLRAVRREYAKLDRPLSRSDLGPYAGLVMP